jgi:uncharacterized protein (UPF0261 family)
MPVVVIATLDTKAQEAAFVRDLLQSLGLGTTVIDAGMLGPCPFEVVIDREALHRFSGMPPWTSGDRGQAVEWAAKAVTGTILDLHALGWVDGVFGLGGSAGTFIATSAMRALPFGMPKVMVSTVASGQVRPFVGGSDIAMFHPVVDLAGLNRFTKVALSNAAHAMAGMVKAPRVVEDGDRGKPIVAATMFGVTTPCVDRAREALEAQGAEVLVFHATGIGGQSMEALIDSGLIKGVLDLTTTELADELVGGVLSAGPDRLGSAIRGRVPQVVSVGALDMVNFGPRSTIPDRFAGRLFHRHNDSVTLMRTTVEENAKLGQMIGQVLAHAESDLVVMLPLGGVSALDAPGMPFHNPEADAALFRAIHEALDDHPKVTVVDRPYHINDPMFAVQAALALQLLMSPDPGSENPFP